MLAKRSIVLLLIILMFSAIQEDVLGGRAYLLPQDKNNTNIEDNAQSPVATTARSSHVGDEGGFVAYVNREVPSSPDPLHNR
ncbi:unnamed protein product [Withania somnifera]